MTGSGVLDRRRAGVLLHPTSLPGRRLDSQAMRFIDFLASSGLGVWQMLPLGPTHDDRSPYHCLSVHALNPGLLSLERMIEEGLIDARDLEETPRARMAVALSRFRKHGKSGHDAFDAYCREQSAWLDSFALYQALREQLDSRPWWQWPPALRDRNPSDLDAARHALADRIDELRFEQYQLHRHMASVRDYAHEHDILLFGDMPIFVARDSADVWAQRHYFKLDASGHPRVVAGVPPDYFSETGQRWGNPLYDWERMQQDGFLWWQQRLASELSRFDLVRVDHFRGFEACWEIPASESTAIHGKWVTTPGSALFEALQIDRPRLPLVAEDLGVITPAVTALRRQFGFPGMLVLQFAFDGEPDNPYLPHNHVEDAVVYTGTHDNDTTLGWFRSLTDAQRRKVTEYLEDRDPMPWPLVRAALESVAQMAILPMQDLLELGSDCRMNTPGTHNAHNWTWQFDWQQVPPGLSDHLKQLTHRYGR